MHGYTETSVTTDLVIEALLLYVINANQSYLVNYSLDRVFSILNNSHHVLRHLLPPSARATNTQQTWRQELLGCRSSTVERPLDNLWKLISLATEAPSDSLTYRRYINNCIYLSIYSLRSRRHNLQLSMVPTSLSDRNVLHRMLHSDSYWRSFIIHRTCTTLHSANCF